EGDRYRIAAHEAIPPTLQALLAARLDSFDPSLKLGLQHVAVLGGATTAERVAALGSPQAPVVLPSLVDAGLLRRTSNGAFDAVDPLLLEVAYETLPHNARGVLHRRAAEIVDGPEERARHLDRATAYLTDDPQLAAEAAAALVEAGESLVRAARHLDAVRLFERAVALGCRQPSVLLELARAQALCGKEEDAVVTLAMVADDPGDPAVGVERDHIAANAKVFTDPAWAIPRLEAAAEQWRSLGMPGKEAWAHANAGVAYFYLSRMKEAAVQLERGLELFAAVGDRAGSVATSSFLCLAKPTDRRVPNWLAEALEFADAVGDRSKQVATLTTLTWHHFFRSLLGRAEDMIEAESFAHRLAALAEELGAGDSALHAWSLLATMARWTGRFEEAAEYVVALDRIVGGLRPNDAWLGWAARFAVTVAGGSPVAAPPTPPVPSPDPVIAMAGTIIEAELIMAGRVEEALIRFESRGRPGLGAISDLAGVLHGLSLVLAGRPDEARPWVDRAAEAAAALDARPGAGAAAALMAEITGNAEALPVSPPSSAGVTDALVLRARAIMGDAGAAEALRRATKALAMPGLLAGVHWELAVPQRP
ncbi:MAG TPA: hypothetical protein VED63_01850, partial [Acidimicrobiales bacterium]|nr:hypothetical protein [Acidimicrobiales bacterium]